MSARLTWKQITFTLGITLSVTLAFEGGVLAQEEKPSPNSEPSREAASNLPPSVSTNLSPHVVRPVYGSLPKKTIIKALDFAKATVPANAEKIVVTALT